MLPVITKIYNKSDFTVQLPLPEGYDGQEFRFTIYTCGEVENGWTAYYIDGQYNNCTVEDDIVTVYVNNNNKMNAGCVTVQSEYDYSNHHFVDNEDNVKDNYKTNIYLVNYETNAFSAQFRPSNLPDLTGSEDFVTYSYLSSTLEDYVQEGELDEYITEEDLSYELSNYITDEELTDMGFVTQSDIDQMSYATVAYLNEKLSSKQNLLISGQNIKTINGYSLLGSGDLVIEGGSSIDLSSYVTKDELSAAGYIASIPSEYVTESQLTAMSYVTESELSQMSYVTSSDISDFVTEQDVQNILAEGGYITSNELSQMSYINTQYLDEASYTTLQEVSQQGFTTANDFKTINGYSIVGSGNIEITSGGTVDLSAYVTKSQLNQELGSYVTKDELSAAGYLTSIPSDYVTENELSEMGYITMSDLNTELGDYPTNNDLALTLQDYVSYSQFNTYTSDFVVDNDLESFVTYDYLEGQGYITINDVPTVDLSSYVTKSQLSQELVSYVTKTELSNAGYITSIPSDYATYDAISQMGYVTDSQLRQAGYLTSIPSDYATYDAISQMGYITSIPSEYVTESELSSMGYITSIPSDYATYDAISQMGYVTDTALQSQLQQAGYITSSALPTMSDYVSKTELSQAGYLTSIPSDYATYDAISQMGYVTLNDIPVVDLSSYVTKTELSNAGYLTSIPNNYATYDAISQMGYITSIPSDYVTESELSSMGYVTNTSLQSQLQQAGYITSSDIPAIPVIDENLIPNTTLTYTLGDSTHRYNATYSYEYNFGFNTRLYSSSNYNIIVRIGNNRYQFDAASFVHFDNSTTSSLGTSSKQWGYTYSAYFIENGINISDIYTQAYVLTQNQYDGLSQADKEKETIYIISDQQAYMNNELVTETSLDSRGFLTAANFNYDPVTGTLTLNL